MGVELSLKPAYLDIANEVAGGETKLRSAHESSSKLLETNALDNPQMILPLNINSAYSSDKQSDIRAPFQVINDSENRTNFDE